MIAYDCFKRRDISLCERVDSFRGVFEVIVREFFESHVVPTITSAHGKPYDDARTISQRKPCRRRVRARWDAEHRHFFILDWRGLIGKHRDDAAREKDARRLARCSRSENDTIAFGCPHAI